MKKENGRQHFRVGIDEKNILHIEEQNQITAASADDLRKELDRVLADRSPARLILDLTGTGASIDISTRLKLVDAIRRISPKVVAVFGQSKLTGLLAAFLFKMSGIKNIRFFSTKNEATSWIEHAEVSLK